MKINRHLQKRIDYRFLYADMISEDEKELYWSAVEDAESSLIIISNIQDKRIDGNGNITQQLLIDQIRELSPPVNRLNESMEIIRDIIEKADKREQKAREWGVEDAWEPWDQQ